MTNPWIEAMRLRTLPVGVAGVLAGTGCAIWHGGFSLLPALICLVFAVTAQIASNFANEYYDFRNGIDRKGRDGFRRGVTEGDISPRTMKRATFALLALDALLGCSLIIWGGLWLIPVGILIFIFALGYSAGPYPLSHHGLGDLTVILFYGLVPVVFTEYVQTGHLYLDRVTLCSAFAIGLMAANVLIINNYRDYDDDRAVGKHTTVVIFGREAMRYVYLIFGFTASVLMEIALGKTAPDWITNLPAIYVIAIAGRFSLLKKERGAALNTILKQTASIMLITSLILFIGLAFWPDTI